MTSPTDCLLCSGPEGDAELQRVQVWEDRLWRLTASLSAEVLGFSYLEPKRHIPYVQDLEGDEAATLGPTLAMVTTALKEETDAEVVYLYVFGGGIPHLHLHLAPHRAGDALNDSMIRGNLIEQRLPSGMTVVRSDAFPPLPEEDLRTAAARVEARLEHDGA
jgi:diadenosine tetraphosphate (Ap4A) HIT family hydrolase